LIAIAHRRNIEQARRPVRSWRRPRRHAALSSLRKMAPNRWVGIAGLAALRLATLGITALGITAVGITAVGITALGSAAAGTVRIVLDFVGTLVPGVRDLQQCGTVFGLHPFGKPLALLRVFPELKRIAHGKGLLTKRSLGAKARVP
jgi:hypothetical protein